MEFFLSPCFYPMNEARTNWHRMTQSGLWWTSFLFQAQVVAFSWARLSCFFTHIITAILPLRHQEKFREGINVTQKSLIARNSNEVKAFKEYVSDKFHFANVPFSPPCNLRTLNTVNIFFLIILHILVRHSLV